MDTATDTDRNRILKLGQWEVNTFSFEKFFPDELISDAQALIDKWVQVFPKEKTWVQREYGIPSLIIRLDCVEWEGYLKVYEIEERPAGIGTAMQVNSDFRKRLDEVRREWPSILVVISKKRLAADDFLWTETTWSDGYFSPPKDKKVLIRAEPQEKEFWPFEPFSVSSLRKKGDKAYGVSLGLWSLVTSENQLPWDEGFVLKPLQGSKVRDVEIFHPKGGNGISTRSRVLKRFQKLGGKAYVQPLIPPMDFFEEEGIPEELRKFKWYIWRIYFAFVPSTREWMPLGGFWNARRNWRIHGASDSAFGPLRLRKKFFF